MTHAQIKELAGGKAIPPWIMNLVSKAIAIEREACAKLVEEPWQGHPKEIAKAIRARSNKEQGQ